MVPHKKNAMDIFDELKEERITPEAAMNAIQKIYKEERDKRGWDLQSHLCAINESFAIIGEKTTDPETLRQLMNTLEDMHVHFNKETIDWSKQKDVAQIVANNPNNPERNTPDVF